MPRLAARRPSACQAEARNCTTEVLPLVPVTPITVSAAEGEP
ncbi:MAG: hypothetical protein RML12_02750 [Xanthomonadales bacterium]|nr:hypothetical protein [Xanthomonadales bacterium]